MALMLQEDVALRQLLNGCWESLTNYDVNLEELKKYLQTNIFYNTLEKFLRNEKRFKEEVEKMLCAKDATFIAMFKPNKYDRSPEHKEQQKQMNKINRKINKIYQDVGELTYEAEKYDAMRRQLFPHLYRKSATSSPASSQASSQASSTASSPLRLSPIQFNSPEAINALEKEPLTEQQQLDINEIKERMKAIDFSTTENINVFNLIPDSLKEVPRKNPNYLKQHMYSKIPFIELVCGQNSSGKTGYITQLISRFQEGEEKTFDKIYLIRPAGAPKEPIYQTFSEVYGIINIIGIENIPSVDFYEDNLNILVILDDCIKEKSKIMDDYFTRGRKKFSMIFLTQSYFDTEKYYRQQCYQFCFFGAGILQDNMKRILQRIGAGVEPSVMEKIWLEGTGTPKTPLLIDLLSTDVEKKFRKGFEKEYLAPSNYSLTKSFTKKYYNPDDDDNMSEITHQSTQKLPSKVLRLPRNDDDTILSSYVTIKQDGEVYFKDAESSKIFKFQEVGVLNEFTNTIDFKEG
jgi:hypothetical protein